MAGKKEALEVAEAGGNVDKIREIIFGGQMRDYDRRFDKLEDRVLKDLDNLRRDHEERFVALDKLMRAELSRLGERLSKEREERLATDKAVGRDLQDAEEGLRAALSDLSDRADKEASQLREELSEQDLGLREVIRQLRDELSAALESESSRLADDKLSRSAMADLLTEVALRLNHQLDLPDGE